MKGTDSAGVPWEGRHFEQSAASDDDGSAPANLIDALRGFHAGDLGEADVLEALRQSRLLIPLVAQLGDHATNERGVLIDKSQELSIVTVEGPDGRRVLPAFTSVDSMRAWNPEARPVPAAAPHVALAAASDETDLVVIDPTSDTEFVMRRPAVWALAQAVDWTPSYLDPEVLRAFMDAAATEPAVRAVYLAPGDPRARLAGPELVVQLHLTGGLDRSALDAVLARLQARWGANDLIVSRVDSLRIQLVNAPLED